MLRYFQYSLLLPGVLASTSALATTDTVRRYYNDNWEQTTRDSAVYSRKAWKLKQGWAVRDYYGNGAIQMIGTFSDRTFKTKIGMCTWYAPNGKPTEQGSYNNGLRTGLWKGWYDNGTPDYVANYKGGDYDGEATWYHDNGKMSEKATYAKGELIKASYWNENGDAQENGNDDESMPAFPERTGVTLMSFLEQHLVYPEKARRRNIEGQVKVTFMVGKDGSLQNIVVVHPVHKLLDAEAVRVVREMPNWVPGRNHNRLISAYFTLPVTFILD